MAIVTASLSMVFEFKYNINLYKYVITGIRQNKLSKDHSYIIIIDPTNRKEVLNFIHNCDEINILFKSKLAVNKVPNHGRAPRNMLVVFELK